MPEPATEHGLRRTSTRKRRERHRAAPHPPPGDLAQTGVVALLLAVAGITWALT